MKFNIKLPTFLGGISRKISSGISKLENNHLFARVPKKIFHPTLAFIVLLAIGCAIYFPVKALSSKRTATATPTLQTAVVRQGSLVVYASGTGTLAASNQVNLSFSTGGRVTDVYVKIGNKVKAGDLLAKVDDTEAQVKYAQAKQALSELTSDSAVASAQNAIAQAQAKLQSAELDLEYLISPDVYYWESQVQLAEHRLKKATDRLDSTPSDVSAQTNLKEAKEFLDFVNGKLAEAKVAYNKEYVPDTFPIVDEIGEKDIYAAPTDRDIQKARSAIEIAKLNIQQSQYLYDALTGGTVPSNATGSGLTDLENAKLELENAQKVLESAHITAPFSGTVMSVNMMVGNTVGTDAVITLADLNQVYVETFIDPTDWDKVAVGKDAEVTFDIDPNKKYTGKVTEVDMSLSSSGGSSVVRCLVNLDIPFTELELPIGASASVDVISGQVDNALLVPVDALKKSPSGAYTVLLVENGTPKERTVEIGLQDLLYAEVKSGLKTGDEVLTNIASLK